MANIDVANGGERPAEVSTGGRISGLLQLVSNLSQRADDHDGLADEPASHNSDEAANGGGILHRRATKFHHHNLLALFEPALSLKAAHVVRSVPQKLGTKKPTARSLLAVGSVNFLKSALLHPFPSSRRHVIR